MILLLAIVAPLHFHFDAGEFANAVYHTACVTARISCSRNIYLRFWNEKYHATGEDQTHFDEFAKALDEVESGAEPARESPFLPNDFSYIPGMKIRKRVLAAALGSKSAAEFRKKAAAFAKPDQAEKLAASFEYFEQRLRPWWVATGEPIVKQRLAGIEQRIRASGATALASEVAGFLDARPDFRDYYLHAVPSPEYDGEHADGTAVANQFCVEITHRVNAEDLAWVAVHEFTHTLYEQAPQDRKDALMRQFVESGDASAQAFYMYLNEAMATAVQLLLVERNGKTLDDPYTDAYIPRLGKAVLPLLRKALENHEKLYDGFTKPYLAAGRAALGAEGDGLQFRFSCVALIADDDVRDAFLARVPLHYFVTTEKDASRYARLDRILMLHYQQVHLGGGDAAMMEALMKRFRGFVYVLAKGERMDVLMLGVDKASVDELGKMWAGSKEKTREGLIFTIRY